MSLIANIYKTAKSFAAMRTYDLFAQVNLALGCRYLWMTKCACSAPSVGCFRLWFPDISLGCVFFVCLQVTACGLFLQLGSLLTGLIKKWSRITSTRLVAYFFFTLHQKKDLKPQLVSIGENRRNAFYTRPSWTLVSIMFSWVPKESISHKSIWNPMLYFRFYPKPQIFCSGQTNYFLMNPILLCLCP